VCIPMYIHIYTSSNERNECEEKYTWDRYERNVHLKEHVNNRTWAQVRTAHQSLAGKYFISLQVLLRSRICQPLAEMCERNLYLVASPRMWRCYISRSTCVSALWVSPEFNCIKQRNRKSCFLLKLCIDGERSLLY